MSEELTPDILRQRLGGVENCSEYHDLLRAVRDWSADRVFAELFPVALTDSDGAVRVAAMLLVGRDPMCPLPCEEAVRAAAGGDWYMSGPELVFYLVTQFGKRRVLEIVEDVRLEGDLSRWPRVETLRYWARMPAEGLVRWLHYWPWQKVIEARNVEAAAASTQPRD